MPPTTHRPSTAVVVVAIPAASAVTVPAGRLNLRGHRTRLARVGVGDSRTDADAGRADYACNRDTANQSFQIHGTTPSKSITQREDSVLPQSRLLRARTCVVP